MKAVRVCAAGIASAALLTASVASASPPGGLDAALATPYVEAALPEIPNNVAVSDTGVIAASLLDSNAVALIDPDGGVRTVAIKCSPHDVAISPTAATAWAVCQESSHLVIINVESGEVTRASLDAPGLDDVTYLPSVDQLLIASMDGLGGQIITVSRVSEGTYEVTDRVSSDEWRFTQLAPFPDGSRTYARTDAGVLLYVDIQMGGQIVEVRVPTPGQSIESITLSPSATVLYAAAVDFTDVENTRTSIARIDPRTGAFLQSVPLDFATPSGTMIDITANHRSVFVASGIGVRVGDTTTGLLRMPTDKHGRLGDPVAVGAPDLPGTGVGLNARGDRVAFGTANRSVIGVDADNSPYPKSIRITASAKGPRLTVTGSTVSLLPMTRLTVHVKDLTKTRARFVKQSTPAVVDSTGALRWQGKAPSQRFAVYVSGDGDRSQTLTVKASK